MRAVALVLVPLLFAPLGAYADEPMAPERMVSSQEAMEYLPHVAYNSTRDEYLVVWHDKWDVVMVGQPYRRIMGRRFDRSGAPVGGIFVVSPLVDNRDRGQPAVAYDGSADRYLVVYLYDSSGSGADWDVRGRFLQGSGASAGGEFVIADTGKDEAAPEVAFSFLSNKYLVTWWTQRPTGSTVDGAIFAFGQTPGAFSIAAEAAEERVDPDVAYQPVGDNFLVAYTDGVDIYAKIVGANGTVGPEIGIAGWPDTESDPSVASCANFQYVVSWNSLVGPTDKEVYVRFLFGDGTIDGGPILIFGAAFREQHSDLACTHRDIDYLVAFEGQYSNEFGPFGIWGRRIAATKALRDEFDIRGVYIGETGDVATRPALAGGVSGWFVAWEYDRQGSTFQDIHGRVVWADEIFADGFEGGTTIHWSSTFP